MNTIRLVEFVQAVGFQPDMLALVEERDGTGDFLVFQWGEEDEQDEALGMTGVCVVRPDGETSYHPIARYDVGGSTLTIELTPAGEIQLGLESPVTFHLDVGPAQRDLLIEKFASLIGPMGVAIEPR